MTMNRKSTFFGKDREKSSSAESDLPEENGKCTWESDFGKGSPLVSLFQESNGKHKYRSPV